MDEPYLLAAVRYVELNPVRARLVRRAEDYPWSSARAHLAGKDDCLVKVGPMLGRVSDWRGLLASGDDKAFDEVRKHQRTGRPLGDAYFVERISRLVGRDLRRKKPGPKPRRNSVLCPRNFKALTPT
jgi:putative transposase